MKKFNILLLIIWLVVIFMFSCENSSESTETSSGVTMEIINIVDKAINLNLGIREKELLLDKLFIFVRKLAHITEYFILGILVINVFKDYFNISNKLLISSILFCLLYSASDEFHQLFVPGRAGKLVDLLIDSIGYIGGCLIYYFVLRRKNYDRVS